MESFNCNNCKSLAKQCNELRSEIASLTQKMDALVELLFHDQADKSCQTDPKPILTTCSVQTDPTHSDSESVDVSAASDTLFDIFCKASESPASHQQVDKPHTIQQAEIPCTILPNQPFVEFDLKKLDSETEFIQSHSNRLTCYFGQYPYSYGNTTHPACPLPPANTYLAKILLHLNKLLPDYQYNSVLLTKYSNSSHNLGFHSDDEPEIINHSEIATISLGEPRTVKFRSKSKTQSSFEVLLKHGDAFLMSKESQHSFEHAVLPGENDLTRISLTLRNLSPPCQNIAYSQVLSQPHVRNKNPCPPESNQTLYISSSMFKGLQENKLTSASQLAKVFSYPGATAEGILKKLQQDKRFLEISPTSIRQIFVMCGTNNVDQILNIGKTNHGKFVLNHSCSDQLLNKAKRDIKQLVDYLHRRVPQATLNIINILPRISLCRNLVINQLNHFLRSLSKNNPHINMIDTEFNRNLFSWKSGERKDTFFSKSGTDNVHLAPLGVARLGKHLKYFAHANMQTLH